LNSCALLFIWLWNSILDSVFLFDSLEYLKFIFASDLHIGELVTVSQDTWNMLINHIFIDELGENLSIINIDTTYVFLILTDLVQEKSGYNENYNNEENNQDLKLVLLFL